ncbi:hypothetical protein JGU66_03345 [Myxococcaceae bacterium JPH2]|nr:hypothetical protein [Myxococcaceae bacterium JPH2]
MKWWFRCLTMSCPMFDQLFVAKYRGHKVRCPECEGPSHRHDIYGNGSASDNDSSDSDVESSDGESSEDELFVHTPLVKRAPITEFLPRTEFHTRLEGSTLYEMTESKYFNTYGPRSASGRNSQSYTPKNVTKPKSKAGGFNAKTGTFKNNFGFDPRYKGAFRTNAHQRIKLPPPPKLHVGEVYDRALQHRVASCEYLLERLSALSDEGIVANADHEYPCLLIQAPGGPTDEDISAKGSKLGTNQEHWTRLVMACFVGVANHFAFGSGLPIEIVMRSSFGHLSPSIAECARAYRINVGIVPRLYLDVLVESILYVHRFFTHELKDALRKQPVDESFGQLSADYFVALLTRRINDHRKKHNAELRKQQQAKKKQGKGKQGKGKEKDDSDVKPMELVTTDDVQEALDKRSEDSVRRRMLGPNQRLPQKLDAEVDNLWDWLWSPGDASGKTVLTQLTDRNQQHLEVIADHVFEALQEPGGNVSGFLAPLPGQFTLNGDSISVTPLPMKESLSFEETFSDGQRRVEDAGFWTMAELIVGSLGGSREGFQAFSKEHVVGGLYAVFDSLNEHFIVHEAHRHLAKAQDGYGSDSEDEADLPSLDLKKPVNHVFSKKLITATGMRAIHLAHYAGRLCASERGLDVTTIKVVSDRMYYETSTALGTVPINTKVLPKTGASGNVEMLFFDINHCNTTQQRYPDIDFSGYDIVILDHTSSSTSLVHRYLSEVFDCPKVQLVLLVGSGLKNEQSGADLNTYGTIRIMGRDKKLRDDLYVHLVKEEGDYRHPKESHAIRRAYKARGFVPTTKNFLAPTTGSTFSSAWGKTSLQAPTQQYQPRNGPIQTFDVIDVPPDGDCLFSALAVAEGALRSAADVRATLVAQLKARRQHVPDGMYLQVGLGYSCVHVRGQEAYIQMMARALVWGGLPEIVVASYLRPILLFENTRTPHLYRNGESIDMEWDNLPSNVLCIAFRGNHYVALRRH